MYSLAATEVFLISTCTLLFLVLLYLCSSIFFLRDIDISMWRAGHFFTSPPPLLWCYIYRALWAIPVSPEWWEKIGGRKNNGWKKMRGNRVKKGSEIKGKEAKWKQDVGAGGCKRKKADSWETWWMDRLLFWVVAVMTPAAGLTISMAEAARATSFPCSH